MTHGHAARLCPVGPKGPKLGVTMVAMVRWSRAGAPGNRKRQFQKFQKPQTPKSPSPRGAEQINPAILWWNRSSLSQTLLQTPETLRLQLHQTWVQISQHPHGKESNQLARREFFTIGTWTPCTQRWNHLIPGRRSSPDKIPISGTTGIHKQIPVRWRSRSCDVDMVRVHEKMTIESAVQLMFMIVDVFFASWADANGVQTIWHTPNWWHFFWGNIVFQYIGF